MKDPIPRIIHTVYSLSSAIPLHERKTLWCNTRRIPCCANKTRVSRAREQTAVGLTAIKTSNSPVDVNGYLICFRSTCGPKTGKGRAARTKGSAGKARRTGARGGRGAVDERTRGRDAGNDVVHCPVARVKFNGTSRYREQKRKVRDVASGGIVCGIDRRFLSAFREIACATA